MLMAVDGTIATAPNEHPGALEFKKPFLDVWQDRATALVRIGVRSDLRKICRVVVTTLRPFF
jgi:hypothetical protein